jgi:hypothetical protein
MDSTDRYDRNKTKQPSRSLKIDTDSGEHKNKEHTENPK